MEPSCKLQVTELYGEVIKDVLSNLEEQFVEEGINQEVLHQLKRIWESKILASKAITSFPFPQPETYSELNKRVPVQIVLPAQPQNNMKQKMLIVYVPAFTLQSNQFYNVLSGPVLSATMSLPQPLAAAVLQQHMDAAFMSQKRTVVGNPMEKRGFAQTASTYLGRKCLHNPLDVSKPSTSGLNRQNLNMNQWREHRNTEKRRDSSDEDEDIYKTKPKKMRKSLTE